MKNNHKTLNRRAFTLLLAILSLLATQNVTATHAQIGGNDPITFDAGGHITNCPPNIQKHLTDYNKIPVGHVMLTMGQKAMQEVMADSTLPANSRDAILINIITLIINAYRTEASSYLTAWQLEQEIAGIQRNINTFKPNKDNTKSAYSSINNIYTAAKSIAKQQKAKEDAKKTTTDVADPDARIYNHLKMTRAEWDELSTEDKEAFTRMVESNLKAEAELQKNIAELEALIEQRKQLDEDIAEQEQELQQLRAKLNALQNK